MHQHKQPILNKVEEVLALARSKYPDFNLTMSDINFRFPQSGQSAGKASVRNMLSSRPVYGLQFSLESAETDIDEMINDTVPHEVAHIVNYADRSTGKDHDWGWQSVCIALGGSGKRTHNQALTKAKYRKLYLYITDNGEERIVKSTAKHNRLQRGTVYKIRNSGEEYSGQHFSRIISSAEHKAMHEVVIATHKRTGERTQMKLADNNPRIPMPVHTRVKPIVTEVTITKPTVATSHKRPTTGTKKERAKAIFATDSVRKDFIARCVAELDMTKAGASTYHSNFKKGTW